ncbi:MAG: hypothetical protein JSR58_05275 [Verrucomicrobia bacterium]|nr:hypothetical protein [Verrucomicrobiota bacterium]
MNQKLFKCALAGGFILFIWGMVSWAVLPWHKMYMHKFQDEERVARVIKDNASESGMYVLPNMLNMKRGSDEMKEAQEQMRSGPFVFASVSLEGKNPDRIVPMVQGLILNLVVACFASWLLMQTRLNFNKSVGFITVIGVLVALMSTIPHWIWFHFHAGFIAACIFETVLGWFFAGLAIAKIAR